MKRVKIAINGKVFEGMWNEKYYTSKHAGLVRVYVDGKEIHCGKEDIVAVDSYGKEFLDKNGNKCRYKYPASGGRVLEILEKCDVQNKTQEFYTVTLNYQKTYNGVFRNKQKSIPYQYVKIVKTWEKYIAEDALSFGGFGDSDWVTFAKVREATEQEIAQYLEAERQEKERKEKIENIKKEVENVRKEIIDNGERAPDGTIIDGEKYLIADEDVIIYGGGRWIEINDEYIYAVTNNGMDGDDWSANNIRTGGAGAIGIRVKKTKELGEKIKELDKQVKELKIKL